MVRPWLNQFFAIFAIVGMVLSPVAPAGAGAMMAVPASATDEMAMPSSSMSAEAPCCANEQQQLPDCSKVTCPLMAICQALTFPAGSALAYLLFPPTASTKLIGPRATLLFAGLAPTPPVRPPRA